MELLTTLAIILTICAIAIPNLLAAINQAKAAKAIGDISAINVDIQSYNAIYNQYPNTLADIGRANFLDPWGNPYQYLNFAGLNGKGQMRKAASWFRSIRFSIFTAWARTDRACLL